MPRWHFSKPRIPLRAVVIAAGALVVPFIDTSFGTTSSDASSLLWLLALVPAFLLAYYRGWQGVATALAAGMALLTVAICIALLRNGVLQDALLLPVITAYIMIALATGFLSEALHSGREKAELIALTDDLTGLPNRRHGRMHLERELARTDLDGPLSVVFFDLDHFKAYNDAHGHPAGDLILCAFAEVLRGMTGVGGLAVRYGGEEFMAVLSACDEAGAVSFADRVREALLFSQRGKHTITVCAGIATTGRALRTANDLIIAADRALYEAKQNGRNCVRVAAQPMNVSEA